MTLFRVAGNNLDRVAETIFGAESLKERDDIQRLLRADITVLDADLTADREAAADDSWTARAA